MITLLAAAMSTLSSQFHVMGTAAGRDVWEKWIKGKGGTIVVVGVFGEKPRVDLGLVQNNELNLAGTLMYKQEDYEDAVVLIASGKVATTPLMSRHFSMDDYLAAYQFIDQARDKSMKVFIDIAP